MRRTAEATDVALGAVALPAEHGGWGFLAEPVLLGLALAPSAAGVSLGLAALAAFLARHPLKLALADRRRGARYPRTFWAEVFAASYGLAALLALGLALRMARASFWLPLALAAPAVLVQLAFDVRQRSRELLPQLAGAIALGALASALVLAQGWPLAPAWALWLLLAARAAASVVYVRARLRLERGQRPGALLTFACHVLALALALALAGLGWAPWLAALAFAVLLARAAHGLSSFRRPAHPRRVGLRELGFGLLTVVLVALGYRAGV